MESQIKLLRAISQGTVPASPENIRKAFNRDVLMERAVARQSDSLDNTIQALMSETNKLEKAISRRESQIQSIDKELSRHEKRPAFLDPTNLAPLPQIESLRHVVKRLSEGYLSQLGLGQPEEINLLLWRLIEITARNEQLLVPSESRLVQFLINERLLRSEPAGNGQMRIRLY